MTSDSGERVVLGARWIVDGVGEEPLRDHAVIVEGGAIAAIQPRSEAPRDTRTVDLGDATLLPGLVDCHVHLPFDASREPGPALAKLSVPEVTLQAFEHAQWLLRMGITTVRDVSCPYGVSTALRNAVDSGRVPGPRILSVGRAICITGGHGSRTGVEADGPAEMRKAVRAQLKAGADWIKLMGTGGISRPPGSKETPESIQILPDELDEAVAVAHGLGHRVACHSEGSEGIRVALEAGVDTIEHGNHLDERLADLMVERGAYLVPTVSAFLTCASVPELPASIREPAAVLVEAHEHCLRTAHANGVNVASGTDSGTAMCMSWEDHYLVAETQYLVDVGTFSPMAALKATTSAAAAALGCADLTGALTRGLRADVIGVPGNALERIAALREPVLVMKDGIEYVTPAGPGAG